MSVRAVEASLVHGPVDSIASRLQTVLTLGKLVTTTTTTTTLAASTGVVPKNERMNNAREGKQRRERSEVRNEGKRSEARQRRLADRRLAKGGTRRVQFDAGIEGDSGKDQLRRRCVAPPIRFGQYYKDLMVAQVLADVYKTVQKPQRTIDIEAEFEKRHEELYERQREQQRMMGESPDTVEELMMFENEMSTPRVQEEVQAQWAADKAEFGFASLPPAQENGEWKLFLTDSPDMLRFCMVPDGIFPLDVRIDDCLRALQYFLPESPEQSDDEFLLAKRAFYETLLMSAKFDLANAPAY